MKRVLIIFAMLLGLCALVWTVNFAAHDQTAEGCIRLPHQIRQLIANSSDKVLEVIP